MRTIIRNNYDPHIGDYHERIIQDEAREKTWLFDCDGVYLDITAGRGDVKVVNELGDSEVFATSQKLVTDELGKKQDTLVAGDNITIEGNVISAAGKEYSAGYGLTLNDTEFAANTSVLATQTDLAGKQDALTTGQLAAVNSGIDSTKVGQIATNTSNITTINGKIPSAATAQNQLADKTYVDNSDNNLQSQIDAISASSDVKDIVGTKAELNSYDTSTLGNNDIIKVLQDESEDDATTYYRWSTSTSTFTLIGEEGPYYTKSQANTLLDDKVDKVTGKGLSTNDFTDADVAKLSGIEAGAEVNDINSISVNGTAVTPDANKNVALTIDEGIKTLTTADYNYPTNNPNTVALWLLSPGIYKITSGTNRKMNSGVGGTLDADEIWAIYVEANTHLLFRIGGDKPSVYNTTSTGGQGYYSPAASNDILTVAQIADNLSSSSTTASLSANQGKVLNGKIVGTTQTFTIADTDWTALSSSDPYTYQATVTATSSINASTGVVELLNDNPVSFGTYGFAIGAVNTTTKAITIYSIGQPSASVTLKINIRNL